MLFYCTTNGSTISFSSSPSGYFWAECAQLGNRFGGQSAGVLILAVTYVCEFFLSIPSNIWLICDIMKKRSKDSCILPGDFFPFHLALIQISFYLLMPVSFFNHFYWQIIIVELPFCFLKYLMLSMKPLLLCLVSIERYFAVVRPMDYTRCKARFYKKICLGLSWCMYIVITTAEILLCSTITVFIVFFFVLAVNTWCSLAVVKALRRPPPGAERKPEKADQKQKPNMPRVKMKMSCVKRKAFNSIIVIQAILTISYVPSIIFLPFFGAVSPFNFRCQFLTMGFAAAISFGYLQPLLRLHGQGRLPFMKLPNN